MEEGDKHKAKTISETSNYFKASEISQRNDEEIFG